MDGWMKGRTDGCGWNPFLKFESAQVSPGVFPGLVLQFFQWGQH